MFSQENVLKSISVTFSMKTVELKTNCSILLRICFVLFGFEAIPTFVLNNPSTPWPFAQSIGKNWLKAFT